MKRSTHSTQPVDKLKLTLPSTHSPIRRYTPVVAAATVILGVLVAITVLSPRWLPLSNEDLPGSSQHETILIISFVALAMTAIIAALALAVISRRLPGKAGSLTNTVDRTESGTPIAPQTRVRKQAHSPTGVHEGRHLLKLNRNTRRLVSVEQDLIRRISENYDIDRRTHRLMTEIQICTNRILSQLEEMENVERVADDEPSDMKLDNITVG